MNETDFLALFASMVVGMCTVGVIYAVIAEWFERKGRK